MKKIFTYIIAFILTVTAVFAQQFPYYNQYLVNKASLFPSYSGFNLNTEAFLTLDKKMTGFPGAPQIADFYIGGSLTDRMGLSLDILAQSSGNINQNTFRFSYAYFIKFSDNTFLNIALTPTLYTLHLNINNIQNFGTTIDPLLNNTLNLNAISGDIGFSMGLHANNLDFAISIPQTLGLSAKLNGQDYTLDRTFALNLEYTLSLQKYNITPTVLALANQDLLFDVYAGIKAQYEKTLFASLLYGYDGSIQTTMGGVISRNIFVSYSYKFGIYGINASTAGSHTLNIGFVLQRQPNFREPSVFPAKSIDNTVIDLQNQIDDLDKQLKKERYQRQREDKHLNGRIDSLIINLPKNTGQQTDNQNTDNSHAQNYNPQPPSPTWVQKIISPTIQFGLNSSKILPSSYGELDKYAQLLQDDPSLKIKIAVHTDNLGSPNYKLKLSQARAKAIADYLLSKPGIRQDQVYWEGHGASEPIASNDTLEGRRKNNRVEIFFNKNVLK